MGKFRCISASCLVARTYQGWKTPCAGGDNREALTCCRKFRSGRFRRGYEASAWTGIGAPRNTAIEIIDTLNNAINAGLADPKIKMRLAELGAAPFVISPGDFTKFIAEETEKWGKVVMFAGIKPE